MLKIKLFLNKHMSFLLLCIRYLMIILLFCSIYFMIFTHITTSKYYSKREEIDAILQEQWTDIQVEMENYPYYDGISRTNVSELSDLVMEKGGNPLRNVIISNWRSGSSFLGDLLSAHPASYFNYEPLLYLGIIKIRRPPLTNVALEILESLFNCDYSKLVHYQNYREIDQWQTAYYNRYLKKLCQDHNEICWDTNLATKFCRLFPVQATKIVGLRLNFAEKFLKDDSFGVKIIYLVRDPRGIMHSRKPLNWCTNNLDCFDPSLLCLDMIADYKIAVKFSRLYPQKFSVLRYEDLSINPDKYSKAVYDFYGIYFHKNVQRFLSTHTVISSNDPLSTYRKSDKVAFQWKEKLSFDEVKKIQGHCNQAMNLWGYNEALDDIHQKEFNSLSEKNTEVINYL